MSVAPSNEIWFAEFIVALNDLGVLNNIEDLHSYFEKYDTTPHEVEVLIAEATQVHSNYLAHKKSGRYDGFA